jgi:hypothetical protein
MKVVWLVLNHICKSYQRNGKTEKEKKSKKDKRPRG